MSALRQPDPEISELRAEFDELRVELNKLRCKVEQMSAIILIQGAMLNELYSAAGCPPDQDAEQFPWRTPKQIEMDFHVVHSTVARWVGSGRVTSKKIGGRVFIDQRTVPQKGTRCTFLRC
jgi:hypothetical protein